MGLPTRARGAGFVLVALFLLVVLASAAAIGTGLRAGAAQRERATQRALALAREALLAYAAERPIDTAVGPGYLPCPDTDDDGWAESTCGSLSGHLGQEDRLGRLPWKTLGLPDLRDGHGERLWYAVSTKYKGLLNCAASRDCRDLTPAAALGTITVRDTRGAVVHDGTLADPARAADGGAVAVVISAGPPLVRADGRVQRRECDAGECDALGRCLANPPQRAARCDPRNYLDLAPATAGGEDNAAFVDRSDGAARARNSDGFIHGPIAAADGTLVVNDRLATIGYADLMPRVQARVALEAAQCLRRAHPLPRPASACSSSAFLGRIEGDFDNSACNLAATEPAWWTPWKPYVLYALAPASGLEVTDASGNVLARDRRFAVLAVQRADDCAAASIQCGAAGCTRIATSPRTRDHHDAVVSMP
jgi:type II secretory pathway pseudopilin PulG